MSDIQTVLSDVLTALQSALAQAIQMRDNPGYFTDSAAIGAYTGAINQVQNTIIPQLIVTLGQALNDPAYAKKWFATATAARSQLEFVVQDSQEMTIWQVASGTVQATATDIIQTASDSLDWFEKYKTLIYLGIGTIAVSVLLVLIAPYVAMGKTAVKNAKKSVDAAKKVYFEK